MAWAPSFDAPSDQASKYPNLALYNLEKDPQEKKNLASSKKELVINSLNIFHHYITNDFKIRFCNLFKKPTNC